MVELDKNLIADFIKRKFELEEENVKLFQSIRKMKRQRLTNIKEMDMLSNKVRANFDKKPIKYREVR